MTRHAMSVRGALLCSTGIGLIVALLTRCGHDDACAAGAPCNESQVGFVCGGAGCIKFVCDGVEYGAQPKVATDPCDQPGTLCSSNANAVCDPFALTCKSIAADASVLFEGKNVIAAGKPCSAQGSECHEAFGMDCETCTCSSSAWVCVSCDASTE